VVGAELRALLALRQALAWVSGRYDVPVWRVQRVPAAQGKRLRCLPQARAAGADDGDAPVIAALFLALACGSQRWPVKTLQDPAARGLHRRTPIPAQVEQLAVVTPPPRWGVRLPRQDSETRLYSVDAWIVAYKLEGDGDVHVVIRDEFGTTMVVEFAHPKCAPRSYAPGLIAHARADLLRLLPSRPTSAPKWIPADRHVPVRIVAPLFFDRLHGPIGEQRSGVELHPAIHVERRR
jgi:hypothetical protein